jgi:hypothetical protein
VAVNQARLQRKPSEYLETNFYACFWFEQALSANPQAMKNWMALSPGRKKEILRYFSRLNSPDARARNLARALHVLSGEAGRFMAREWKNGS